MRNAEPAVLQVYASLPDGSYTFSATAENSAGVAAAAPLSHSWTVTLSQFAQVTASPAAAATNLASVTSQQIVAFAAYSTSGQDLTSRLQVRLAASGLSAARSCSFSVKAPRFKIAEP